MEQKYGQYGKQHSKFTRICQENLKTLVAQYESNIIRTLLLLFWISHLVVVSHVLALLVLQTFRSSNSLSVAYITTANDEHGFTGYAVNTSIC